MPKTDYNTAIVNDTGLVMIAHPNINNPKPIAVFDSGVGGISVLKHIHHLLPNEHLLYVADSIHAPYGNKSATEIQDRCFAIAEFLIAKDAKALVVACNTATAAAIDQMRAKYRLPMIGMEPAVKPAAAASSSGIIGVLATTGTLQSAQFAALLESYGRNVEVVTQACIGLVECVERGELSHDSTRALIKQYCKPLLDQGADSIVLGCTHYPFLKPLIQEVVGEGVVLIDTGAAVANQLKSRLFEQGLLAPNHQIASVNFWSNSPSANPEQVITQLWGESVKVSNF